MSEEGVKTILQRAIADDVFRSELNSNFDAAIAGSGADLTFQEREALQQVNWSGPLPSSMTAAGTWVHIYSQE
jgi:hypothetical protein